MRRIPKWAIAVFLTLGICCGLPSLWFFAPKRQYAVGANIRDLGLHQDPRADFHSSPVAREKIQSFLSRTKTDAAHFSGSLVLAEPGHLSGRRELHVLDGRLAYYHASDNDDPLLKDDLRVLRKSHLRDMLKVTKNDWRIRNHNNHFIEPSGPFTGTIRLDLGSSVFIQNEAVIEVQDDIITSSNRQLYPLPD